MSMKLYAYLLSVLAQPLRREEGATAVEYGLLVALIAAVIITTVATLGSKINTAFNTIVTNLK